MSRDIYKRHPSTVHEFTFGPDGRHHVMALTGVHGDPAHIGNIREIEIALARINPAKVIMKIEAFEDGDSTKHNFPDSVAELVCLRALADKIKREKIYRCETGRATMGISTAKVMQALAAEYPEYPVEKQILLSMEDFLVDEINRWRKGGIVLSDKNVRAAISSKKIKDALVSSVAVGIFKVKVNSTFSHALSIFDRSTLDSLKTKLHELIAVMIDQMLANVAGNFMIGDDFNGARAAVMGESTEKYFALVAEMSNRLSTEEIFIPLSKQLQEESSTTVTIIYFGARHLPIYESFKHSAMQTQQLYKSGMARTSALVAQSIVCASKDIHPPMDISTHVKRTVSDLPFAKKRSSVEANQIERATSFLLTQ